MKRLAVAALLLLSAPSAWAVCSKPTPKVCSKFFDSEAVFGGTVVSEEEVPEADDFVEGWLYQLRVGRVFRGDVGPTTVVHTANDSGRLVLEVGQEYLLFAQAHDGRLQIGNDCGPLSDPKYSAEAVRQIESLSTATTAVVEGEVVAGTASGSGVPGVNVTVSGMGHMYRSASDERGLFEVVVPPGRYSVVVDAKVARLSDLSWRVDPSNLVLVAGQCAQLQFIAR